MSKEPPPTAAELRALVLKQVKPFMDMPEYAVTDPSIVDKCVTDTLARANDRARAIADAVRCVDAKQYMPEGLALIDQLVAKRYEHPVITRTGDNVLIDVGVIAGKLSYFRGSIITNTDLEESNEWKTSEAVRFLKLGMAQYPDAKQYQVYILIPTYSMKPDWLYVYDRAAHRVWVSWRERDRTIFVLDNVPEDLSNIKSLRRMDLTEQPAPSALPWR